MTASRIYLLIAAAVFLIDRLLKFIVFNIPSLSSGVFMIDDVFGLGARLNREFAWSLPLGNDRVIIIAAIILAGLLAYALFRPRLFTTPLAFILAGAVSNLIDRLVWGGAIDYVLLPLGGAVNLADGLIFAGVILLLANNKKMRSEANKLIIQ